MWRLGLLLGCVPLVSAGHMGDYVVLIPAELHYPTWERVCYLLSGLTRSVRLTIQLNHHSESQVLVKVNVHPGAPLECVSFQVPAPSDGSEEVANITVYGSGPDIVFRETKTVLIRGIASGTFIQTDKPIYKPGQKVSFRIVTLREDFVPVNDMYDVIELEDPNGNRIGQWLNVVPQQGIVDLSYPLASEPPLGTYTINVETGRVKRSFDVAEYVLPKFEVKFVAPTYVYILDVSFEVQVCGRYTYGKPVEGSFTVTLCRKVWFWQQNGHDLCQTFSGRADVAGCFSFLVNTTVLQLSSSGYYYNIDATASLLEDGTGVRLNGSSSFFISSTAGSVVFEDMDEYFHPGQPFQGSMKVLDRSGSPLKLRQAFLDITTSTGRMVRFYTTGEDGRVSFSLDTAEWDSAAVSLEGRMNLVDPPYNPGVPYVYYQNAYATAQPFYSNVNSYLRIHRVRRQLPCHARSIQVEYIISRRDLQPHASSFVVNFLVTGKGGIVAHGQRRRDVPRLGPVRGEIFFPVTITSDFGPAPRILVFILLSQRRVVADNTVLHVNMCFRNKVSLRFSQPEELPGSSVDLLLTAAPGSLCAVRAVDQSVLLMKPETELSNQTVYNLFPYIYRSGYPWQVDEYDDDPCWNNFPRPRPAVPIAAVGAQPFSIWRPWYNPEADVFSLFKENGLKILSNCDIKKPKRTVTCPPWIKFPHVLAEVAERPAAEMAPGTTSTATQERARVYFPETWIWSLIPVGSSGTESVPVTVPDTITDWKAMMFCTAQVGFGISPTVNLIAFKPFFVELTLPYSIVRGESFNLKATVFNYLTDCIEIQITLADSQDFLVAPCPSCLYGACLCADSSITFSWDVTATTLGEVKFTVSTEALSTQETAVPERGRTDTLIEPLLVRPEGVPVEKTRSSLLCVNSSSTSEAISLAIPQDIVKGSERAVISVLGDLMGSALQNLDRLIQMPYGCGEQNMVTFAPIIYVLQYLEKTGQLTNEIRAQANGFLVSGYQRELTYKHGDGSYSAFGNSDGDGNTWLTAFVAKCFGQALHYIFIDENNVNDAVTWLGSHQSSNGCFANVGRLFHTAMKGGVDDEASLSAYCTVALLELGLPANNSLVTNGFACLTAAGDTVSSAYTKALLAYAYTLAGDAGARAAILEQLEQQAIESDGMLHWSYSTHAPENGFWNQPLSVDIELTAYVLLSLLSVWDRGSVDIARASLIVRWLSRQQNAYGGFASTQDTVVALQALARYAELTYHEDREVAATVRLTAALHYTFIVNKANRLVLQQQVLNQIPRRYWVSASGDGCVLVQVTARYNIPPQTILTFVLSVETEPDSCPSYAGNLLLHIRAWYNGSRSVSNMAIMEVAMLSGYAPADDMKEVLLQNPSVRKVEVKAETVYIYLDELSHEPQEFSFWARQDIVVENLQPAMVKVYDYYQPEENALAPYNDPCS
ncbi:alpha-2-macroglobulin-like protein 1 isoform X2 [Rhinatrema bivittatum]|uniref:alpha-2-macroglobulin-like protein 1 isoform X2 n=1 Tax=Rhinatrema bivittatum TaxID=194408 RepID=UPI0011296D6C|nr:alpha-2-macroglobulin-like protein 1 isoform X2 [Rhinatrema bivittatum]